MIEIESILVTLKVTGTAQRVYLELLSAGPQSVLFLSKKLTLPRPTIYDALHILEAKSLVISQEVNGKSVFSISNPQYLLQLLDSTSEEITQARKGLEELLPTLLKSPRVTEPKIKMFSGKEGGQQVMRDILWYKDITTYTLWPMHKMIDVITPEFLEWHNKRRVTRNISLDSIRKFDDTKIDTEKYPYLGTRPEDLREIKYLPKGIDFSMSYWIYDDNVAFISADKELYGFIVHSRQFSDMMKMHFDLLSQIAK